MHDVACINTGFVHSLCKSAVANTAVTGSAASAATTRGSVIISSAAAAGSTTHIVITSSFLCYAHVLEIGIDVTYDVLLGAFAF